MALENYCASVPPEKINKTNNITKIIVWPRGLNVCALLWGSGVQFLLSGMTLKLAISLCKIVSHLPIFAVYSVLLWEKRFLKTQSVCHMLAQPLGFSAVSHLNTDFLFCYEGSIWLFVWNELLLPKKRPRVEWYMKFSWIAVNFHLVTFNVLKSCVMFISLQLSPEVQ